MYIHDVLIMFLFSPPFHRFIIVANIVMLSMLLNAKCSQLAAVCMCGSVYWCEYVCLIDCAFFFLLLSEQD